MIQQSIVFYDGVCGLCDRSVQFLIKHDHHKKLRYAALQSDTAKELLKQHLTFDSFVLYHNNKVYTASTAALKVLNLLGGFWKLTGIFYLVPLFMRDGIYNWVARHRYNWFGKFDSCKLPSAEQRSLFIDT